MFVRILDPQELMQNTGLNGGGGRVRAEDVISKLKDDGDFDRLRLKIIRKLKENVSLSSHTHTHTRSWVYFGFCLPCTHLYSCNILDVCAC